MNDIPVDRAGRPMYDAEGRKLSIAEREAAAESQIEKEARMRLDRRLVEVKAELKTAEAAHHWVVIERDKLRVENTELRELCDKADIIMERMAEEAQEDDRIRTLAQAMVDASTKTEVEIACDALAKALGD
jgi:regulator of replication initiation timing